MKGFTMKQNIVSGTCLGDRNECAVPATGSGVKRTPIAYYGGKLNMLKHILPMFPEHKIYVEPFFGGGAVFFAKQPSPVEVINDTFDLAIIFYREMQQNFEHLQGRIRATLHAERHRFDAQAVIADSGSDDLSKAWAFWVLTQLTFAHKFNGGFAFGKDTIADTTTRRIERLIPEVGARLRHCQIFCRDALDVIRKYDTPETFFYFDPPYANSDCGHYEHGKSIYYDLLQLLPTLQGKWLLSSYPTEELGELWKSAGVYHREYVKALGVTGKNAGRKKTETLTWNYEHPA